MATILGSLNYNLQLDKDAQHILENSHNNNDNNIDYTTSSSSSSTNVIALTSTPTITTLDTLHSATTTTTDFLHKLGATFINSIQLNPQTPLHMPAANPISGVTTEQLKSMDFPLSPPQIVINTDSYGSDIDELQKQLEYDRVMNEVWIGIVLTLILISLVFCFCSCFLYHQFRVWKRNYRSTLTQNLDSDNVKISMDIEDPVPEYTLVSGLPSYDAALELLQKNPKSCLLVHPSVFEIFNKQEKSNSNTVLTPGVSNTTESSENSAPMEASMPLLNSETLASTKTIPQVFMATLPSYSEATSVAVSLSPLMPFNHSSTNLSMVNEKSQLKSLSTKNLTNNNEKSTK